MVAAGKSAEAKEANVGLGCSRIHFQTTVNYCQLSSRMHDRAIRQPCVTHHKSMVCSLDCLHKPLGRQKGHQIVRVAGYARALKMDSAEVLPGNMLSVFIKTEFYIILLHLSHTNKIKDLQLWKF